MLSVNPPSPCSGTPSDTHLPINPFVLAQQPPSLEVPAPLPPEPPSLLPQPPPGEPSQDSPAIAPLLADTGEPDGLERELHAVCKLQRMWRYYVQCVMDPADADQRCSHTFQLWSAPDWSPSEDALDYVVAHPPPLLFWMLPHLDGCSDDRPSRRSPGSSSDDSDSSSVGVSVSAHALFSLPFASRQSRTEFDPQRILEAAGQLQRQLQMLRSQNRLSASSELRYQ